jgi:hypothetical protein
LSKIWQRRYCVLAKSKIFFYKNEVRWLGTDVMIFKNIFAKNWQKVIFYSKLNWAKTWS